MTVLPSHSLSQRPSFPDPGADRASALGHVVGVAGFLLLPIAVFAPLAAAPLLGIAALLVLLAGRQRLQAAWAPLGPAIVLVLLLLVLGAVSSRWSVAPATSLRLAGQLALTAVAAFLVMAGALVLDGAERRCVRLWLICGVVLGIALMAVDWQFHAPLLRLFAHRTPATAPSYTRLDRAETVMAVLVWPAVAGLALQLRRGGRAAGVAGIAAGVVLVVLAFVLASRLPGAAGKVALGLGALGFLLACLAPRAVARLGAVLVVLLTLLMPLAPPLIDAGMMAYPGRVEYSSEQRVAIWYFVSDRIREKPVSGWGLDASRAIPSGHDQAVLPSGRALPAGSEQLPLHPHNNALQWWLELGVGGALLCSLLMATTLWRAGTYAPRLGVATAAALGIVMMVSYGAWQFWWLATIAFTVAMVIAVNETGAPTLAWRPTLRTLSGRDRY